MNNTSAAIKYDFSGWSSNVYTRPGSVRSQYFLLLYALSIALIILIMYKIKEKKISYLPETGVAILIGSLVSFIAEHVHYKDMANVFDPEFFFWFLLPPVIFQAGYIINQQNFFSNWFAIMIFANVGTVVSTVVFAYLLFGLGLAGVSINLSLIECFCFGSLISATDPVSTLSVFSDLNVEPALYAIVYGSSAIDDAVAIVMFRSFQKYLFKDYMDLNIAITVVLYLITCVIASSIIGIVVGGMAAVIIKKINLKGKYVSGFVFCLIYISYFLCTMAQLSGIISCMFTAISFKYCLEIGTIVNFQDSLTIDQMLSFVAYFLEMVIFFCIGMSVITALYESHENFSAGFTFWALLLTVISRAVFVYPLSFLSNVYNCGFSQFYNSPSESLATRGRALTVLQDNTRDSYVEMKPKLKLFRESTVSDVKAIIISRNEQHMMIFAGLRGPIAYAAASQFRRKTDNSDAIYLATLVIILFNVFINGSFTEIALKYFNIKYGDIVYENPKANTSDLPNTRPSSLSSCNIPPCIDFVDPVEMLDEVEAQDEGNYSRENGLISIRDDFSSIDTINVAKNPVDTRRSSMKTVRISNDLSSIQSGKETPKRSSKMILEWLRTVEKRFIIPLLRDDDGIVLV
jgi:NhaP-type Na+/H+ or K+/H+ antiporter